MLPRSFRIISRVPSPFWGRSLLDELFQGFQDDLLGGSIGRFDSTDIYEKDGILHYELELSGMEKGGVTIRVVGDRLIVIGEVDREDRKEGINYISRVRGYEKFKRWLPLPEEVENPDELKLNLKTEYCM